MTLFGALLILSTFFSKSNFFSNLFTFLQGPQLDFGWQQYSQYGTGVIINILIFLFGLFLCKKGMKLIKSKTLI